MNEIERKEIGTIIEDGLEAHDLLDATAQRIIDAGYRKPVKLERLSDESTTYTVELCSYDDLPQQIKDSSLSDNGTGKEYANYLVVRYAGNIIRCESDAMEPEDTVFYRDLLWIKDALEEAYKLAHNQKQVEAQHDA